MDHLSAIKWPGIWGLSHETRRFGEDSPNSARGCGPRNDSSSIVHYQYHGYWCSELLLIFISLAQHKTVVTRSAIKWPGIHKGILVGVNQKKWSSFRQIYTNRYRLYVNVLSILLLVITISWRSMLVFYLIFLDPICLGFLWELLLSKREIVNGLIKGRRHTLIISWDTPFMWGKTIQDLVQ